MFTRNEYTSASLHLDDGLAVFVCTAVQEGTV